MATDPDDEDEGEYYGDRNGEESEYDLGCLMMCLLVFVAGLITAAIVAVAALS